MKSSHRVRRHDQMLLPECLDDYISADNPVRALDVFVDTLDLGALGFEVKAEHTVGAPTSFERPALLKLLIYGYLNQIRSSRKLEAETRRNLEVIWLTEKAQPDHWTINEFRKVNLKAFKAVLRSFHRVCRQLGLFGGELQAIDGSFFKALNNKSNNFTEAKLDRLEAKIDAAIDAYNQALDQESPEKQESGVPPSQAPAGDIAIAVAEEPPEKEKSGVTPSQAPAGEIAINAAGEPFEKQECGVTPPQAPAGEVAAPAAEEPPLGATAQEDKEAAPPCMDPARAPEAPPKNLRAVGTLEELQAKKGRIGELREEARQNPSGQVSGNDPDSRLLKKGNQSVVGHNVQSVVDGKNHLLVHVEIVQAGNDRGQLEPMARAACEALGIEPSQDKPLDLVADGGYYNAAQIQKCEEAGMQAHVPIGKTKAIDTPGYRVEDFEYDSEADQYICPEGQRLTRHSDITEKETTYRVYYHTGVCRECPCRQQCTQGQYRKIKISQHREIEQKVAKRMEERPEIYARRKELAEHPFGTIKSIWGYGQFMVTGAEKCEGELHLMAICYNWKRVLSLIGMEKLIEAIGGKFLPLLNALSATIPARGAKRRFSAWIAALFPGTARL